MRETVVSAATTKDGQGYDKGEKHTDDSGVKVGYPFRGGHRGLGLRYDGYVGSEGSGSEVFHVCIIPWNHPQRKTVYRRFVTVYRTSLTFVIFRQF